MSIPPAGPPKAAPNQRLIRDLGVLGWESREPVIVAALARELPLLLVGPHGVAKSLLLERLAAALGADFRHYNASTLNFDDLVGFPVPKGNGVEYLRTPVCAWDAEAIFLDEINRCRPDMQNRLFPLIHERKLQGLPLPRLAHRWAAMNPNGDEEAGWVGTERLDTALADRFTFILETPHLPRGEDRLALIRGPAVAAGAGERLRAAVAGTCAAIRTTEAIHGEALALYVDSVADALTTAGLELSGRRLRRIWEALVGVVATGLVPELKEAAYLTLRWAIPQRAQGNLAEAKVVAAHQAAWRFLVAPEDPIRRALLGERDPLLRVVMALAGDDDLLTATVLDSRAALAPVERLALSARLFPWLVVNRPNLPGVAFEALAEDVATVNAVCEHEVVERSHTSRFGVADEISRTLAENSRHERAWLARVLWAAFVTAPDFPVKEAVAFATRVESLVPAVAVES